ncbi:hypothetical protein [Acinetobacter sp. ANC 4805]|uniref:hypothetical protein n=1 Tax=Acinetobacter sp. ANC 4805 TaxID=2923425 RepID=UPI001F4B3509|nr:hypothetical protein [Acinetobacter sp. ANC 4805]MCH7311340.1 hypothetical protein [Acinetobacter sp. ANC 4805]
MNDFETNGYLTCTECSSLNRVKNLSDQGIYKCGTCKSTIMIVSKEKKSGGWGAIVVISISIGITGYLGVDKIHEMLKLEEISYSKLKTTWTEAQIQHFDMKCKASFTTSKPNWSAEKIAKTCTCYVSFIVENTDFPIWGKLSDGIVSTGDKKCR